MKHDYEIIPASRSEIAAALPFLGYMGREAMLPSIWRVVSRGHCESVAVFALHANWRTSHRGLVYDFVFIPLSQQGAGSAGADVLRCVVDFCQVHLAADGLLTSFTLENSQLFALLQAAGFKKVSSAYEMAATNPQQIADAFAAGREIVAQWAKDEGIVVIPYSEGPEEAARELHLQALGLVPDGHYILFSMLDSDKDYTGACMAMKDGEVLGHVMVSHRVPDATSESIVIRDTYQGTPLVAHMCAEVIASVDVTDYQRVLFSVNTANERSLGFTGAFDSVKMGMRHQLYAELLD